MRKIKSLNLMVTDRCNGACNMCNIWKSESFKELNLNDLIKFLKLPEFSEVEDLSISGGEPMLKSDIQQFSVDLIKVLPKLKMFFINTNGLMPEKTLKLARVLIKNCSFLNKELQLFFSISIEGPKEVHELIRGRSYDLPIQTISLLKNLISDNLKVILSMTIQRDNYKFIAQTSDLAKSLGCDFSFRFVDFSENYYNNISTNNISLNRKEASKVLEEIKNEFKEDRFFQVLYSSVCKGVNNIMVSLDGKLICQAGRIFIFIKNDGNIYPCIYSEQIIGNIKEGLFPFKLDRLKSCPCCTECHIYPMLNFAKHKK
ncbi:MAG: radical SAM protein [Bacilli bacterium]|nr:radical SAM protein [Bacilli bacterium]